MEYQYQHEINVPYYIVLTSLCYYFSKNDFSSDFVYLQVEHFPIYIFMCNLYIYKQA